MFCSLHSSNSEQDEDEDTQDDRQKLIKVHSKKTETSQLVQEEKAETGNVCDNILREISRIKALWLPSNVFIKISVFTKF